MLTDVIIYFILKDFKGKKNCRDSLLPLLAYMHLQQTVSHQAVSVDLLSKYSTKMMPYQVESEQSNLEFID